MSALYAWRSFWAAGERLKGQTKPWSSSCEYGQCWTWNFESILRLSWEKSSRRAGFFATFTTFFPFTEVGYRLSSITWISFFHLLRGLSRTWVLGPSGLYRQWCFSSTHTSRWWSELLSIFTWGIYLVRTNLPTTQWTLMVERLGDQGGMSLPTRFVMYVDMLVQLVRLLSRQVTFLPHRWLDNFESDGLVSSPLYDPTTLELLRMRHLRLRLLQGIPGMRCFWRAISMLRVRRKVNRTISNGSITHTICYSSAAAPGHPSPRSDPANRGWPWGKSPFPSLFITTYFNLTSQKRRHWAEKIFDDQPHSTTGLRHRRE